MTIAAAWETNVLQCELTPASQVIDMNQSEVITLWVQMRDAVHQLSTSRMLLSIIDRLHDAYIISGPICNIGLA